MTVDRPYELIERMRQLCAPDPEGQARSELGEDIPQEARWLVIRDLWSSIIAQIPRIQSCRHPPPGGL
jgi:hypothetical protein